MATGFEQALLNLATQAALEQAAARNIAEKQMVNASNAAKAGALDRIAAQAGSGYSPTPSGRGYSLPQRPPANASAGSTFQAPQGESRQLKSYNRPENTTRGYLYSLPQRPPANGVAGSVFQAPRGGSIGLR